MSCKNLVLIRLKSSNLYKCSTFHESEGIICKEEGEFDKDLDIKYQIPDSICMT